MRFTNLILAAGLTASTFAAPVAVQDDDTCIEDVEPASSAAVVAQTSSAQAVATSAVAAVATSSAKAVATPTSAVVATSAASSAVVAASSTVVAAVASSKTSTAAAVATSAAAAASTSSSTASGKLQFIGANESGAEFGTAIPGTVGTDYTFPNTTAIQTLIDGGMNIFRVPFLMERMTPTTMTSTLDATYLASYKEVIEYITTAGAHAIMEPHNYGRYAGSIFTSTSDFQTFWTNVATEFADNDNVIFDCNNEFHDEPTNTIVAELSQACVDGVRGAGATSQYIFVEGTSYTGAWTWTSSGNAEYMVNITDPNDNLVYEFHQYLDSDGSGTSSTCVSSTIGAERIADATAWLKTNNFKGIIGEFAGGVNSDCESAISGMLDALATDNEYWLGALWWGAGPWWGDYIYAFEPPSGIGYVQYMSTMTSYLA